jgi:transcriptional regulator with XRE-family HTH domain
LYTLSDKNIKGGMLMIYNTTGEKIRYFREELGFSQAELSKETEIEISLLQKYETNIRKPSFEKILAISRALNLDFQLLLDEDELKFFTAEDLDKSQLVNELCELRFENEILRERLIQILEISSL